MHVRIDGDLRFYLSDDESVLTMYDDGNEIVIHINSYELDDLRKEIR